MGFKELLDKYKSGTANEQEKELVEAELEKSRVIEEYLADRLFEDFSTVKNEADGESTKQLKKAVNRKTWRMIICSAAVVVVLLMLFQFAIKPIFDSLYYNPNDSGSRDTKNQFEVDVAVFTELHFPGYSTEGTTVTSLGWGQYDIGIRQYNPFSGYKEIDFNIERNRSDTYMTDLLDIPHQWDFYDAVGMDGVQQEESYNEQVSELEKLPGSAQVSAYFSFNYDLTMDEYAELLTQYEELTFTWTAVRYIDNNEDNEVMYTLLGFNTYPGGLVFDETMVDKDKYPYLDIAWNWDYPYGQLQPMTGEVMSNHFISLLEYLTDYPELAKILAINGMDIDIYRIALDYVKENGVKTYGVQLYGSPEDILRFLELDIVKTVQIDDVKVSKYEK